MSKTRIEIENGKRWLTQNFGDLFDEVYGVAFEGVVACHPLGGILVHGVGRALGNKENMGSGPSNTHL